MNKVDNMDEVSQLRNQVSQLKDKRKKITTELRNASSILFRKVVKEFFDINPKINSISWNQYTPYFNDGDELTFSSNTEYITVNGTDIDSCRWYPKSLITHQGTWDAKTRKYVGKVVSPNPQYDEEMSNGVDAIRGILGEFDDQFYLEEFGDHKTVEITPEGINTSEYDHE